MSSDKNDVHIKLEASASVCFVCGELGTEYTLHSRTREHGGAFFPFLEQHKHPAEANGPDIDGTVPACSVCYFFLLQQWEGFERINTPTAKRKYWLNWTGKMDIVGEPEFAMTSGSDASSTLDVPVHISLQENPALYKKLFDDCLKPNGYRPIESVNGDTRLSSRSSYSSPSSTGTKSSPSYSQLNTTSESFVQDVGLRVPSSPSSYSSFESFSTHSSPFSLSQVKIEVQDQQVLGSPSQLPHLGQFNSTSESSILSNTVVPDHRVSSKPSSHSSLSSSINRVAPGVRHACFICGDYNSKFPLMEMYSKPFSNYPFFPTILTISKPRKAKPMGGNGKVECCQQCYNNLIGQWVLYQNANVPFSERYYHFRKYDCSSTGEERSFVCFACGHKDARSLRKEVNVHRTGRNEPCFAFLKWQTPAPGAKHVSDNGNVSLCSLCYKSLLLQVAMYQMSATPEEQRVYKVLYTQAGDDRPSTLASLESCLLCKSVGCSLVLAETEPQNYKPFFPFLKDLDQSRLCIDYQGRVPVCTSCYNYLIAQWETFEVSQLPPQYQRLPECITLSPGPNSSENSRSILHNQVSSSDDRLLQESKIFNDTSQNAPRAYNPGALPVAANPLPVATTCFICAEYSPPENTYRISAFPVNENKHEYGQTCTPFFPFLSTHVPSSGAERLTEDGKAMVCTFCCHSLQAQWLAYETSSNVEDGNRWLRKYNVESCKYGISFVEM